MGIIFPYYEWGLYCDYVPMFPTNGTEAIASFSPLAVVALSAAT